MAPVCFVPESLQTSIGSFLASSRLLTAINLVTMTTSLQPLGWLLQEDRVIDAKRLDVGRGVKYGQNRTMIRVSEDPDILVAPEFLSEEEVDELLAASSDRWYPSLVDAYGTGEATRSVLDRSSYQCHMDWAESPLVERIEARLAEMTGMTVEHLEQLTLVRYSPGQFFNLHHDGPHRPKTVFVYLTDSPDEGETYFPLLGMKFTPRRGTAVMWRNCNDRGQADDRLYHQALPPETVTKVGMNCFFNGERVRP
ncbi:P4H1 [Symbiodinium sp. CCMP2456]|nr:P4H1 [Symbiodinium sp. CCMP2456]